jgi:hypothetical protein
MRGSVCEIERGREDEREWGREDECVREIGEGG